MIQRTVIGSHKTSIDRQLATGVGTLGRPIRLGSRAGEHGA